MSLLRIGKLADGRVGTLRRAQRERLRAEAFVSLLRIGKLADGRVGTLRRAQRER